MGIVVFPNIVPCITKKLEEKSMVKQLRLVAVLILFALLYVNGGNISQVDAQSTPTKQVLVVVNDGATNKFGRYLGEILKAEGLNNFDVSSKA